MEQVIWVEILSRHHDVLERHRCTGPEIRIGRGYDNDVVLDDPYVAPRHLRVFRGATGTLVAEDAGSANGLFTERGPVGRGTLRRGRVQLDPRRRSHAPTVHLCVPSQT